MTEIKEKVQYSKYQIPIFDTIMTTNLNIVVNATAGSGKTFTAVEISKLIPISQRSIFLAFNKSIVEELQTKLSPNIKCTTIHSLGMNILMEFYKTHLRVNEFKIFMFCEKHVSHLQKKEKFVKMFLYREVIDKIRLTMCSLDEVSIMKLAMYYDISGIESSDPPKIIEIFKDMEMYNYFLGSENNVIDYTDMIYLPVTQARLKLPQYDFTIIDELQDLNKCQQEFVKKLIGTKGRFIGLGDDFQCIYSFLGADSGSFQSFVELPNTIQLPLSVSYRCAKEIVLKAREICDTIEPFEDSPQGEVRKGTFDEIVEGDFVLCRNNRPLIFAYLQLIKRGLKCTIKGKDIETGLLEFILKFKNKSTEAGLQALKDKLTAKAVELKEKRGVSKPENNPAYLLMKEKLLTIETIVESQEFAMMDQVIKFIEEVFDEDKGDGVQLMTIHKSKGLEARRVFYIEKFEGKKLIPSTHATQPWELKQEQNLLFVAITRAKEQLIYLNL